MQDRGSDVTVSDELAAAYLPLEQHLEAVPWLQVGIEINFSAEDLGELERQLNLLPDGVERADERRVRPADLGGHGGHLDLFRQRHDFDVQRRHRPPLAPYATTRSSRSVSIM